MSITLLIPAAGRGLRAAQDVPKQYAFLGRQPVLARTLERGLSHRAITSGQVVIHDEDRERYAQALSPLPSSVIDKLRSPVIGAASRQGSVHAGLEALVGHLKDDDIILIHDAARPYLSHMLIDRALEAIQHTVAAIPGLAPVDSFASVSSDRLDTLLDRSALRAIQTPQAFRFAPLLAAHRRAQAEGRLDFTDDGSLMRWAGHEVIVFKGDPANRKLTVPEDFMPEMITKTGLGYDVHAFGPGNHIWLGGLKLPHTQGVIAHSDGDVALHALTDAILGALAEGDIGQHFPPSDPQWKDASSDQFLRHAVEMARARGGVIDHLDVIIICEAPKIGPHREAMQNRIAEIAGLSQKSVSIKATTSERLGFTGRAEGLAAQAIATIRVPS